MRILGVGGGGGNILSEIAPRVPRADFVALNTDVQALKRLSRSVRTVVFGSSLTHGLGCGMSADLGEKAAQAEKERIAKLFENQDVCVLVASLGGGTGSGAAPVVAEIAKASKVLTLGVFTLPFAFEGEKRLAMAERALEKLKPLVSSYIVIPNERIFEVIERSTSLDAALSVVNKYLAEALSGLIETIYTPGLINIDFADLKSILDGSGRLAYLHSVRATGPAKAQEAARHVLSNPMCTYGIEGVDRMLFNISADKNLKMQEVAEISKTISSHNPKARIIFGISSKSGKEKGLRITLFAVGCKEGRGARAPIKKKEKKEPQVQEKQEVLTEEKKPAPQKSQKKKRTPKAKKKTAPVVAKTPPPSRLRQASQPRRRNAMEVKQAADQELQEIEEQERKWDVPAFLRNRYGS